MVKRTKKEAKGFVLTLYIASMNARARFAVENIKKFCDEYLEGQCQLEIIDLRENPSLAVEEKVVATPMLIKRLPLPVRTFIGNMHQIDKILVAMEINPK